MQTCIRGHHSHQCYQWEIQPFCDHLGSHEHVGLMPSERLEDAIMRLFTTRDIPIPAQDTRSRKLTRDLFFHSLRSHSQIANPRALAGWAHAWIRHSPVAAMADEPRHRCMIGIRYSAIGTAHHEPAVPAQHYGGTPPAVEEQEGLLRTVENTGESVEERRTKHTPITGPQFLAHIHYFDRGHTS
jgi:hypothetical protein